MLRHSYTAPTATTKERTRLQPTTQALDVQDKRVEDPEQIVERKIEALKWLSPKQTLITSSCGMNHLPREVAFGKLAAMAGARDILRGVLAPA